MVSSPNSLYRQVVDITSELLGPASERFIARQIMSHLSKSPEELTAEDLTELTDWIKLSITMLTEDTETIQRFADELHALTQRRGNNA